MTSESAPLPQPRGSEPAAAEVRQQLERVLSHRDFEASDRLHAFLRFIVEQTLAGRGHRLKAYTVAVEVFGRPADFDANLDPIVRIQAGRLRRALEHYYLVAGGDDPIVITVPRGGYRPLFTRNEGGKQSDDARADSVLSTAALRPIGVAIAVLPLRQVVDERESAFFADGLTEELSNELSRYQHLAVIPCRRAFLAREDDYDHTAISRHLGARFLLEGSVRNSDGLLKTSVRLIDGSTGQQIWADGYQQDLTAGGVIATQEDIARSVAGAVAAEYGIIPQRISSESRQAAPAALSTYEAILQFYEYEAAPTPESGARCFAALQAAVTREPEYGPAWAALSVLLRNAYILDLPGAEDPRGRAAEFARRGAALAPENQLARGAMAHNYFVQKQRGAFLREIEATLQLNPGSPFYLGTTGYMLILADEEERGHSLLSKAIAMNPLHPWWFNHGLCVYHYRQGDYDSAHAETLKAAFDIHFWGPLLRASVLGRLGREEEAHAEAMRLVALVPRFEVRAADLVRRPILSESMVNDILEGLRLAGLSVRSGGDARSANATSVGL
jgi:adenylate cyclase